MRSGQIAENVKRLLEELPGDVELVAAAKARTPDEIREAIDAGIKAIGENYLQEAQEAFSAIDVTVRWHFIGHLQKNKVKKAVEIFDMIETIDSVDLAEEVDKRCVQAGKTMDVLVEVNSGKEDQKFGVFPEETRELVEKIAALPNIRVKGLMTMGPFSGDPEDARPYFVETRKVFEEIRSVHIPGAEMTYLSMGMTNSYRIAIEEGANIVRIFGERDVR